MLAKAFKNKKEETFVSAFCTLELLVLEQSVPDFIHLYEMKKILTDEETKNYPKFINHKGSKPYSKELTNRELNKILTNTAHFLEAKTGR